MKGPDLLVTNLDEPTVYLKLYYTSGKWALREGCSAYIEDAMENLERKMGSDKWNELSPEDQIEAALEQSKEDVLVTMILGTVMDILFYALDIRFLSIFSLLTILSSVHFSKI